MNINWETNITKISSTHLFNTLSKILQEHSERYCLWKCSKNVFARNWTNGKLIATLSICLDMTWSTVKQESHAANIKSSLILSWSNSWMVLGWQNKSSIQMPIILFKEILVNILSTSIRVMEVLGQKLETSSGNENESCTKKPSTLRGDKIGTKNLANLQGCVLIANKIGLHLGQLLITGLWTFGVPYKIPPR